MFNSGYVQSILDGTENVITEQTIESSELPLIYSYENDLPSVHDQGESSTCAVHSVSAWLDWRNKLTNKAYKDTSIYNIYDNRKNKNQNGMSFKTALDYLKSTGSITTKEYRHKDYSNAEKINDYARIPNFAISNINTFKSLLITNGPILTATHVKHLDGVYDGQTDFWNGTGNFGGHATCFVGYNEKGFILRNSWGYNYGDNGYAIFPYIDIPKLIEAWTIID